MTVNSGLSLDSVDSKLADLVNSGIRSPRVKKLTPGTKLFRFADADRPKESWPAGPWWFGRPDFNRILQQSIASPDFGLGFHGRRNLAIRQCWSKVNGLVEAEIIEEIFIFYGAGTTQYREPLPNGMMITWQAPPEVEQWFLSGISNRAGMTELGHRAISVYRTCEVKSYQLY
ncbi:MAG: hypothetical protein AAF623_16975 [Planctomycetota bacterium]